MLDRLKYFLTGKRLAWIAGICAVVIILIVVIAVTTKKGGKEDEKEEDEKEGENVPLVDKVVALINNENIRANIKYFAKEPHPAGGQRNLDLGAEVKRRWESYGFDDVFNNDYEVLLSLPTEESYIKYKGEVQYKPRNNEDSNIIPPFNAFSKNDKVTGQVVYVNYGRVEDLEKLVELNVDLNGKIAICRYGKIFRGSKAQNAFEKGMIGMILYSDPADSGSGKGDVYPDGQWLPDTGVQRGNVKSVKGDISTHLYPSYEGAYHATGEELAKIAPKIPVIPIPYNDIKPIHAMIQASSPTIPEGWGNYKIGPSTEAIELNVKTNDTLAKCRNIIGVIHGNEEPDRYVLVGVHRDAWIHGAVDPVSGMSTILEISRALGEQLKTGWRPRRTIIFASWDAEEPGIMGSYEFAEDFMIALKHKAVAYINMDSAAGGIEMLRMKSTPNLISLLYDAAKKTESPKSPYETMYDFWIGTEKEYNDIVYELPPVQLIGSGSDYTAFLNEIGVSCVDFAYKTDYGTYPMYHTQYDTYEWLSTYGDVNFTYHKYLGDFAARTLLSLANDEILPLSAVDYANKIQELTLSLITKNPDKISDLDLEITGMMVLAQQFVDAATKFQEHVSSYTNATDESGIKLRNINDKLMLMDRQFIHEQGLPGRPSFRHLIFAPSSTDTYAGSAFPGIGDELNKGDRTTTQKQIGLVTAKLEAVTRSIDSEVSFL